MRTPDGQVIRWIHDCQSLGFIPMPSEVVTLLEDHRRRMKRRFIRSWVLVPTPWVFGLPLYAALYYSGFQATAGYLIAPVLLLPVILAGAAFLRAGDARSAIILATRDLERGELERFGTIANTPESITFGAQTTRGPSYEFLLLPVSQIALIFEPSQSAAFGRRLGVFTAGAADQPRSPSIGDRAGETPDSRPLSKTERLELQRSIRWSPVLLGSLVAALGGVFALLMIAGVTPVPTFLGSFNDWAISVVLMLGGVLFAGQRARKNRMRLSLLKCGSVHRASGTELLAIVDRFRIDYPELSERKFVEWFPQSQVLWTMEGRPAWWRYP